MPTFPNAQNLTINGGQFIDVTNNNGFTGIDVLLEASRPDAAHDAAGREYSPRCFPGTRKQYIEDIVNWGVPALGNTPLPLYWMKGPAGVGKSAVAQTCAEELKKLKKLGAAFFFSISGGNQPEKFFPSIAYQLSTIHPPYRDLIDKKLRHDKTLVNKMMRSQFSSLIEEPLRELASQGKAIGKRVVIIIDGLDECEGVDAQREIIHIIAGAALDETFPLCWAFFSRPEPHIEGSFTKSAIAPHCHRVILPISRKADREIELYLKNGFENILQRHNVSLQSQWPSAEDMKTLVGAARGSFIYATTVLRFVNHGSLVPQECLRAIIDTILYRRKHGPHAGTSTNAPFAELDVFYTLILQRIPPEIFSSVHLLLALLCRRGTTGAIFAANRLGMSKGEFEAVCNHTSAVVHFQEPGKDLELDPTIDTSSTYTQLNRKVRIEFSRQVRHELGGRVSFYHKSFSDFLLDPARSGNYCAKGSEALANHYVKMHLNYDQTYSWKGSDLVLASGVADSATTLSYPYTNELVNSLIKACVYTGFGRDDPRSFPALGMSQTLGTDCDFRKRWHVFTHLTSEGGPPLRTSSIWGCQCRSKVYPETRIHWILFAKCDINEFKLMVKQYMKANVIQRYHPKLSSRIVSLFRDKTQGRFESALYRMGHGQKSIFWYWEIDYQLGHYREYRAIDLAQGEKRFREEDFDAWPKLGQRARS